MTKSWRERIAEARKRGGFTPEDRLAWNLPETCLVGEALGSRYNLGRWLELDVALDKTLGSQRAAFQTRVATALIENDFNDVEYCLELAEDEALRLKREAAA